MKNFFLGALAGPFIYAFVLLATGVVESAPESTPDRLKYPQTTVPGPWIVISIDADSLELKNTLNILHKHGYWVRKIIDSKTSYRVIAINRHAK